MPIVLWIDPGTTTVWYAIIEKQKWKIMLLDYGVISTTPKLDMKYKLLEIGSDIKALLDKYNPDLVSVEKLYFLKNITTGIDVAQARGVIVYEAIKSNILIEEYTPLQVKKAITSNGKANKKQMQTAIKMILWLKEIPKPDDAADAIAIAYIGALNCKK